MSQRSYPFSNISTNSVEEPVIETGGNSVAGNFANSHTGLIDNAGICGTQADVSTHSECGVSKRSSSTRAFLIMKLAAPKTILKLQLAFRTDGITDQGKNVRVQVGSTSQYNANDPICVDIPQLSGIGLVEYDCNQYHEGQYVILSSDQSYLTICEAKVFVEATTTTEVSAAGRRKRDTHLTDQSENFS